MRLSEIKLKPNMVITFKDRKKGKSYNITIISYQNGLLAVYDGVTDNRKVIATNQTVADLCSGELLFNSDVEYVYDFNLPTNESKIYEQVQMTIEEIEEKLGIEHGTLSIKEEK